MLPILDNLNEEQRKTLKQFRLNLENFLSPDHTDYILVKYLRAKNFDLKVAEKVFKENYYTRITFGVNTVVDTYEKPEVAKKYESVGILGFAKNGSLIRYTACGRLDIYGFIMSMSCHEICLYFCHIFESDLKRLKEQNLKTGKNIQEVTFIVDLEGFTIQKILHKNVIEMGLDFISIVQDYYPEIWSHFLIVNASKIFDKAFNLFKPVMQSSVLERIYIADKASSRELLLEYIDENVLPAFLGGNRVDSNGDPECKEFITFGGTVPEKFYTQNNRVPLSPSDPGVKCLNIRPRSIGYVSIVIEEANTKTRFRMRSDGSIYTSLLYREFDLNPNDIELPNENDCLDETADNFKYKQITLQIRVQGHCTEEDDLITLKWPGIYVWRFNNSSSWFTSRKVFVKFEILSPSEEITN